MQRPTWLALSKTSAGAAWRADPLAGRQASHGEIMPIRRHRLTLPGTTMEY
jgi:hypothetical protein